MASCAVEMGPGHSLAAMEPASSMRSVAASHPSSLQATDIAHASGRFAQHHHRASITHARMRKMSMHLHDSPVIDH